MTDKVRGMNLFTTDMVVRAEVERFLQLRFPAQPASWVTSQLPVNMQLSDGRIVKIEAVDDGVGHGYDLNIFVSFADKN